MSEFFAMGGHAAFIWPSWGLATLGVAGLIAFVLAERRAAVRALQREEAERDTSPEGETGGAMDAALRFAPLILLGVLIAVLAVALLRPDSPEPPQSRLTGQPLPALELQRLDGKPGFDLTQAEGPYLLNIWGSWCPPCRIEHPVLMDLAAEGVPVYGIAWRDRPANARAFLAELGDPYAGVMLDPDSRAAIALGVTGAPETFVIGADGRVALRWAGPLTEDVVERRIRPALERR